MEQKDGIFLDLFLGNSGFGAPEGCKQGHSQREIPHGGNAWRTSRNNDVSRCIWNYFLPQAIIALSALISHNNFRKVCYCNCFVLVVFHNRKETGHVCALAPFSGMVEREQQGLSRKQDFRARVVGTLRRAILSPQQISKARLASEGK